MMVKYSYFLICLVLTGVFVSCKKYLETKSNQALATPSTLMDLTALLNRPGFQKHGPQLALIGTDEFYLSTTVWQGLRSELQKKGYGWDPNLNDNSDWQILYNDVFYANSVLYNLEKIERNAINDRKYDEVRGRALFFRAHCFFQLAQLFAPQYNNSTAASDLGIPLRLDPDFNKIVTRATIQQTYDQIISDLQTAAGLLDNTSSYNTQPNKACAIALLARTYLQIGKYQEAKQEASAALQIYGTLIDYNDPKEVDTLATEPFKNMHKNNKEIIFYFTDETSYPAFYNPNVFVDSLLYSSYESHDLRKVTFFKSVGSNKFTYKGSYSGSNTYGAFVGLGTAELYLIKAEANARLNQASEALATLDQLLIKRYRTGTYSPKVASDSEEALNIVLQERRKEMVFRGVRWFDLKRLNHEANRSVVIVRKLDQTYTLPPNDPRYTLLIPYEVIQKSDVLQNPR